ncbi:lipase chaperone [Pseudomonas sp. WN033]|nr:lipase chaperone [Pseudomonas sp. WN033]
MKPLIYLPLLLGLGLLGWHLSTPAPSPSNASPAPPQVSSEKPATAPMDLTRPVARSTDQHLPASLRDTDVDGQLEVDAQGNLVITDQLRHLFDYFFSTVGEQSFEQASTGIRDYLASQLREPALGQALDLLDRYINYKTGLVELERRFPMVTELDGLRAREDAVQRLRASLFNAQEHAAFFASEEVYNQFTLERLAILHDPSLDPQDKAERIERLREGLPDELQQLLVPQLHLTLRQQTQQLLEQGAEPEQLRQLRLNLVGPQATERLEALDRQRSEWDQRLSGFNRERQAIISQPGLADSDKQAAIETLLHEQFSEHERLRVSSLLGLDSRAER